MPLRYLDSEINPLLFVVDSYCFNQDQSYVHESQITTIAVALVGSLLSCLGSPGQLGRSSCCGLDWRLAVTPLLSGILYCFPWHNEGLICEY